MDIFNILHLLILLQFNNLNYYFVIFIISFQHYLLILFCQIFIIILIIIRFNNVFNFINVI